MRVLGTPATEALFWSAAACLTAVVTAALVRAVKPADKPSLALARAVTVAVPVATLGLYALLGRPDLTALHTLPVMPPSIAAAVDRLKQNTERHPDDSEAWLLLGDVNRKAQRFADAEASYRHALVLDPGDADLKISIAQSMLAQDGGRVTVPILALLAGSPDDPVSRYYLALAKSQAADWPGALADWQGLQTSLPAGSPLLPAIEARILQAQRVTGAVEDR